MVKSHTPNDPHSSGPPNIQYVSYSFMSRAYVTDTTSYFMGFAWTLLGEHAAVILY